ncbi:MAG: hypothetical protein JNL04_10465 [Rhodospirillaceae bacterium]|nr:hypothetical protein [Rhodospirillaceae bacterium]
MDIGAEIIAWLRADWQIVEAAPITFGIAVGVGMLIGSLAAYWLLSQRLKTRADQLAASEQALANLDRVQVERREYLTTQVQDLKETVAGLKEELRAAAPQTNPNAVALARGSDPVKETVRRLSDGETLVFQFDPRRPPILHSGRVIDLSEVVLGANTATVTTSGGAIIEQRHDGLWTARGTGTSGEAMRIILSGRTVHPGVQSGTAGDSPQLGYDPPNRLG